MPFAKSIGSTDVERAAGIDLKAAVACYEAPSGALLRSTNPLGVVGGLKFPCSGPMALDVAISFDQVQEMNAKLAATGGESKIIVYPTPERDFRRL